jgi:hypothetical protein
MGMVWSFTTKEEYTLEVFENRLLRRIFGFKMKGTAGWRKLQCEDFRNLYSHHQIL